MARGLNGRGLGSRPLSDVFAGRTDVTKADLTLLRENNIRTAADFARVASDSDLTDNGCNPEQSIRLIRAFEQTEFYVLLDYSDELDAERETATAEESETEGSNADGAPEEQGKRGFPIKFAWTW